MKKWKPYTQLLFRYLRPQWRRLLLLLLLVLIGVGLKLFNPFVLRYFIDTALSGKGVLQMLWGAAAVYITAALAIQLFAVLATYLGETVGWTATNQLRADLTRHILQLDMSFHKARTPGELVERIDGDVTLLANFFSQFMVMLVSNLLILMGGMALLFAVDWRVGAAVTAVSLLNLLISSRVQTIAAPRWVIARQKSAELFSFIEERLAGTEDIQANGAGSTIMHQLHRHMAGYYEAFRRATLLHEVSFVLASGLFFVGDAVGMTVAVYLFVRGEFTLGTVYLVYNYATLLFTPLEDLQKQIQDLQKAVASIDRIRELLAVESKIKETGDWGLEIQAIKSPVSSQSVSLSFNHVSFGYEDDRILDDVSFDLEAGQVMGLLGRTGSGKTTLTRLLFRLYDPDTGVVKLNGRSLPTIPLAQLRQQVGIVTQDVQLFEANVRDNLTFFDETVGDEAITAVLHDLGLQQWLASLPDGLDTVLQANNGLSAGEGQLLAFARAFLQEPRLVILDEPSSRLDPATEQLLERAVDKLLHRRTGIIIAHRLATVQRADVIMVMGNGRILEYGRRAQLAADPNSHFYQLLHSGLEELDDPVSNLQSPVSPEGQP
jgi:ABC-type multidrug transport system fused ATPase/permease subunit